MEVEFTLTVRGEGEDLAEAWEDAVNQLALDPGDPPSDHEIVRVQIGGLTIDQRDRVKDIREQVRAKLSRPSDLGVGLCYFFDHRVPQWFKEACEDAGVLWPVDSNIAHFGDMTCPHYSDPTGLRERLQLLNCILAGEKWTRT
jgi:hypothetical protein